MARSVVEMIGAARAEIEFVSPEVAKEEMAAGEPVLLDIREPIEWEQHIAGALQVPRGLVEFVADPESPRHNADLEPTRRLIVYCASGSRGALATLTLQNMGFENVANLDGGLKAWIAAGLPVVEHHADL